MFILLELYLTVHTFTLFDLDTSSQQVNNGQYFDPATPAALNEGITHGFFSDLLCRFTWPAKKRKFILPITDEDGRDITLDENSAQIADAVYQSVISCLSEMFEEYKRTMNFQFDQLESRELQLWSSLA